MSDIIQEAREYLDRLFDGGLLYYVNGVKPIVRGLLERIEELERVYVPVGSGSPETLLRLLDENRSLELQLEQAQRERDAALERVRVLEQQRNDALERARELRWAGAMVNDMYGPKGATNEVWGTLERVLRETDPANCRSPYLRYQHVKTGGIYEAIGHPRLERDGTNLVVYRLISDPSKEWARPSQEFYDGRFVKLEVPHD